MPKGRDAVVVPLLPSFASTKVPKGKTTDVGVWNNPVSSEILNKRPAEFDFVPARSFVTWQASIHNTGSEKNEKPVDSVAVSQSTIDVT